MSTLKLRVSIVIAGDPADMGNANYVAVQVSFENSCATGWAASIPTIVRVRGQLYGTISSGFDLCGLL